MLVAQALRKLRHPSRLCLIRLGLRGCGLRQREKRIAVMERDIERREKETARRLSSLPPAKSGISLESLDLSVRSYNCLLRAGLYTADDVIRLWDERGEAGFREIRNLGAKSFGEISRQIGACTGTALVDRPRKTAGAGARRSARARS